MRVRGRIWGIFPCYWDSEANEVTATDHWLNQDWLMDFVTFIIVNVGELMGVEERWFKVTINKKDWEAFKKESGKEIPIYG